MRRTKNDMQQMESDVRYYLTYNNYDPHKAYDNYIKDHLLSGRSFPHYINGIKDFIKLAGIMQEENKQREQQKIKDQEYKEQQQNIITTILNLPVESFIKAYRQAKQTGTENHKMALCDMATLKNAGELKEKFITRYYIDVCKQYNLI